MLTHIKVCVSLSETMKKVTGRVKRESRIEVISEADRKGVLTGQVMADGMQVGA